MNLTLERLIPVPLREKVDTYVSGIWKNNVELQSGSSVFIQAPSGTGKTTLIHILYGMRKDFEGTVKWGGQNIASANASTVAKLRATNISVIFQDMRLFPDLTAWENIEIKRKLTDTITEQQAWEWMERLGLKDKRNAKAATMSYGEQQRLSIVRALLQPFDWLLMDEPFSHLDHVNINKAITLICEVVQQRRAGILLADLDENTHFPYSKTIML